MADGNWKERKSGWRRGGGGKREMIMKNIFKKGNRPAPSAAEMNQLAEEIDIKRENVSRKGKEEYISL